MIPPSPRSTLLRPQAIAFAPSLYPQLLLAHSLDQAQLAMVMGLALLLFLTALCFSPPPLLVNCTLQNAIAIASASSLARPAPPPTFASLARLSSAPLAISARCPPSTPRRALPAPTAQSLAPPPPPHAHPALRAPLALRAPHPAPTLPRPVPGARTPMALQRARPAQLAPSAQSLALR